MTPTEESEKHVDELALETRDLGKRYRRTWGLRGCDLRLPAGRVAALVGPNGAGKSTLMALAAGLIPATEGRIEVLGRVPDGTGCPRGVSFLGQDKPLYKGFTVAETLRMGRGLNPDWDGEYATRLIEEGAIPLTAKVGTLSGGQRTRVAIALALGRRPRLLLLDEPLADLDPLARDEVMKTLMASVADTGTTVLLSSHILADLEDTCDHLVLVAGGRVALSGDVEDLLAAHHVLIGAGDPPLEGVVESRTTGRQSTVLVRAPGAVAPPGWRRETPTLEELVLSHLRVQAAQRSAA
ncbi:ABC transporter ATP-binding protein [Actinorhabdospora filicis]|uniref:ABC transporter ATP-binding protein n=1 Tax=Actinorhabdospora filicis TaxID=1785913 RepID=A0A9W6SMP5_9ACTN|nr:ABC transporter ATP-binding protein [Actinorhabdospora filicis]GLZ78720.1 ABC transporter ATP-binding protein [Actinorhabdospora filicis]